MWLVTLPVALYGLLHIVGRSYPAYLWGADQLHYYPLSVTIAFVLVVSTSVALGSSETRLRRVDDALFQRLAPLWRATPTTLWLSAVAVLFVLAAYLFGDRSHHLGDSAKWFAVLDHALSAVSPMEAIPAHHSRLELQGFEYVNTQQALDLFIHFQLYQLGHELWNWTAAETYEWTSCVAGGLYAMVLWRLVFEVELRLRDRLTLLAFLLTLGVSQLFFGYGESYTLVTAAVALYVLSGFRCLRGEASILSPTLLLGFCAALHLLSLSLLPSWLYLLWHDGGKLGQLLRRPGVYAPLMAGAAVVCVYACVEFYLQLSLPLWQADENGKYAILSVPHAMNLVNEILLLSPFGLLWGLVALWSRKSFTHICRFPGLAAAGAGALITVHYISMGGRDWDLMAFPGLPYSLWGFLSLAEMSNRDHLLRKVRWLVLPLMVLHTGLWVGINHDPVRAKDRLGELLQHSPNQALHYQHFVKALYHLNIRQENPHLAAEELHKAIAETPAGDVVVLRRYQKYLGQALVAAGDYTRADSLFQEAFSRQQRLVVVETDVSFHTIWTTAMIERGKAQAQAGEGSAAEVHWQRAIEHTRKILTIQPSVSQFQLLGMALQATGRPAEAVEAYRQSASMAPNSEDRIPIQVLLAQSLQQGGRRQAAIDVLKQVVATNSGHSDVHHNLGNLYYTDSQFGSAAQHYELAIRLDATATEYHYKASQSYLAVGDSERAAGVYEAAIERHPDNLEMHQGLAQIRLAQGDDKAALRLLTEILNSEFQATSDDYTQAGIDLFGLGQTDAAAKAYERALAEDASNLAARNNLGWCQYLQGDVSSATATFRSVLARGPSAEAQFNLGLMYLAQGNIVGAKQAYSKGVAEFGIDTARRVGAIADVEDLIRRDGSVAAEEILRMIGSE